jgi:hypothetical protein
VAVPLVLTRDYIHASLDSFPIEFLNMKRHYRVIWGEDVLANLEISPQNLRLQLERELKGKLLHLREGLLGSGYDRNATRDLLGRTISTFAALIEAFLFLKNEAIPDARKEVFKAVVRVADLDGGFVEPLFRLQEQEARLYREELWQLTEAYIAQIEKLTTFVDHLEI